MFSKINKKNYNVNIYFVAIILIMFVLENFYRTFFLKHLALTPDAFPKIWQFITYAFHTGLNVSSAGFSQFNVLWFIFHVLIVFWFGRMLEANLGSIRYVLFLLLTLLGESIVVYLYGPELMVRLFGLPIYYGGFFDLSLMMMFGLTFPKEEIYIFFVIRVRVLYLAIFYYLFHLFMFQIWNRSFYEIIMIFSILIGSGLGILVFKIFGITVYKVKKKTGKLVSNIKEKKAVSKGEAEYDDFIRVFDKLKNGKKLNPIEKRYYNKLKDIKAQGKVCVEEDFEPETEICKTCEDFKFCVNRFLKKLE